MSTRAEKFKSSAERTHAKPETRPSPATAPVDDGRAAKNATYAREEVAAGTRPSRRSTRKSANRAKTDTGEVRAEQMAQSTPSNQARRNGASAHDARIGTAAGKPS